MHKIFFLIPIAFLLSGCAESVALLGGSVGGISNGKIAQSSFNSVISYGVKKQTGKSPLEHAIAYAEVKNPEKKKETCISFIEKTRSEFCTILNKKIALTNTSIKNKTFEIVKKYPKNEKPINKVLKERNNFNNIILYKKKSPRQLAIDLQAKTNTNQD